MEESRIVFKLKEVRTARKLSQNALARLCNMSVANIQKYERQEMKSIPFKTLAMFCEILNCSPTDLFEFVMKLPETQGKA